MCYVFRDNYFDIEQFNEFGLSNDADFPPYGKTHSPRHKTSATTTSSSSTDSQSTSTFVMKYELVDTNYKPNYRSEIHQAEVSTDA